MEQEWILKSKTIWGVIIAFLTAVIPAVGLIAPDLVSSVTPEWLANLNTSVTAAITAVGAVVGAIMVVVDRFSGNAAKTLTWQKPE